MLLMNEAIERLKQEASSVQGVELKTDNKKNWMSSAQLWISNSNSQSQSTNEEENRCVTQTCNNNNANQRGAIMSFNRPPPPPPSAPLSLPKMYIRKHTLHPTKNFSASDQPRETQNLITKVRETTSDDPKLSSSAVPASVRHAANKST
ncbi:hypothetical protein HID58_075506 [Brassica napus]|uniref:Uncharacterized protein n=1 Tax=Brassica napus TaxID=3708 RepID=A0ABQ7YL01_BRANA|nr:hypothetical protein HID58_075506 [Brassica napus]